VFWWERRKEMMVKVYGVSVGGEGVEEKIWCQVGGVGLGTLAKEEGTVAIVAAVGVYEEEKKR